MGSPKCTTSNYKPHKTLTHLHEDAARLSFTYKFADMLTTGGFTRDEWNHLLRLFNSMNFSITMLKRAQERKLEEEPAVAKPRSACLVPRTPLSARQTSSLDSGASYGPVNQELGQNSVSGCTGKPARDGVQSPATNSQERHKDDNPFLSTRKLVQSGVSAFRGVQGNLCEVSRTNLQG